MRPSSRDSGRCVVGAAGSKDNKGEAVKIGDSVTWARGLWRWATWTTLVQVRSKQPMQLSKAQQAVVDKMKAGWRLKSTSGLRGRCWLSNLELCTGGSLTVRCDTVHSLLRRGLLGYVPGPPVDEWFLI